MELEGGAPEEDLRALADLVDRIAEIPNSLRRGTEVRMGSLTIADAAG